jgi:hypothetical protein
VVALQGVKPHYVRFHRQQARPIQRINAIAHEAIKARMRPIRHPHCLAMFDRIVMEVIAMAFKIPVIADLPHKQPRKSKANPTPTLSPEQKQDNTKLAQVRVQVEHAIGLTKGFHCLTHRVRNHLDSPLDTFMWLGTGLHNLKISSVTGS